MTATGAWYTDSDKATGAGGNASFEMSSWLTLTPNAGSAATIAVKRADGQGKDAITEADYTIDVAKTGDKYIVLPGDLVTVEDGNLANITANAEVDFYYAVKVGDGAWKFKGYHAKGTGIELVKDAAKSTDLPEQLEGTAGKYYVKKTLDYTAGVSFTLTIGANDVEVRAIQAANMAENQAKTILTGATFNPNN